MSYTLWFTGLSGSGKSTVALAFKKARPRTVLLDGDVVRKGLCADLGERVKELRCVYELTSSIQDMEKIEDVFRCSVALLPSGFTNPEITRAKVRFDGREYASEPFDETEWKLTRDIVVAGKRRGSVEVYRTEEHTGLDVLVQR